LVIRQESNEDEMKAPQLSDYENPENSPGDYQAELKNLQKKLAELMVGHIVYKKRSIIVFEGWDAAGKGGAIKRLTAEWDPRAFSVWPISAPSKEEKSHNFLWRFWKRLPAEGQISVFDRSWYGRVLVERVEEFATEAEWQRAYDEINAFERHLAADGTTIIKLFLHVSAEVQDERLKARLNHPWKQWKVGPEDFRNRERRSDYVAAMRAMFDRTHTEIAPWTIINGNEKKSARIAALQAVHDHLRPGISAEPPPASEEVISLARDAFNRQRR
jgi:AMP-polyphosphate phosphotransferase